MKVVLYARVSKDDNSQNPQNQLVPLRKWAESLDYEIVQEYVEYISGGNSNRPQFKAMMEGIRLREFSAILVFALDRFSREPMLDTLSYFKELKRYNVQIKSLKENWVDMFNEEGIGDVLLAFASWFAWWERKRLSERTKAGLAIAKANGKLLGRPNGSKDKGRRRTSGYLLRWQKDKVLA